MLFLFTFAGGNGHFLPTLPIARELAARGHQVRYACQELMVRTVEAEGLIAIASGGRTLLDPSARRPLVTLDRNAEEQAVRGTFAGRIATERAGRVREIAGHWKPDAIIRDELDFGAAVAAEALEIPHAGVTVLAAGGMIRAALVADPLTALRAQYGLGADPALSMLHRYLTLTPVPPSYRDPTDPLPSTAHHLRPAVLEAVGDTGPAPPGDRPTVYFTLGTIFHQESGDLFGRVLAGLRDLAADVIVTVGRELDPRELGEQPAHVRVERFIPHASLLPHCAAVVSHAGSGSVIGALAFGVPSVLLPMGADQPLNGDRCAALGVAKVLDPVTCSPQQVGQAVLDVLDVPSYRAAASRLRIEIRELPHAGHGADLVERLAIGRGPIVE
ncbi:glycosyltransferase [Jatrophihabitans lederbergiae]|uniref:Glycosyltransferase n=1 Tax=Jatrophihabitans lederbergiae TaxID=3075547 RepID=A0ABU2JG38_9ACTN|nr:glycosyltransferase [Jatrophihabitans sp. DSM 44399]MDT0263951.1 glycosyltransferase [Jatrophihabitans sp. DSM 44399]